MKFISTRNANVSVTASQAIVSGIADDGGLYVPSSFPIITLEEISKMQQMSYPERAAYVIGKYLDEFEVEELLSYTTQAYSRFDGEPAPLSMVKEGVYALELYHGPTLAFKDMALTLLPYLLTASKKKNGVDTKTLILVATSGDTGKAAMEGFKDVEGTEIIVLFPSGGVSRMQEAQMRTQEGANEHASSIIGNFDDAQSAVKHIFNSTDAVAKIRECGYELSSANSINWGRLVPQIVYYISAYVDLVDSGVISLGEEVNYTVPTGNFGNILACYYAKRMGLPVGKMVCASNSNKVLTDFITTGTYDISDRQFFKTESPSMDILISSNLERLIFELSGRDASLTASRMQSLKDNKSYSISLDELTTLQDLMWAGWCDDEKAMDTIAEIEDEYDYPMDTHTAVAMYVSENYISTSGDDRPMVVVSTASPYKFPQAVYMAMTGEQIDDAFEASEALYEHTAMDIPEQISALKTKPFVHTSVCEKDDILDKIISFIS